MFETLTQAERDAILDPKGMERAPTKGASDKTAELPLGNKSDNEQTPSPTKPIKGQDNENAQSSAGRPKKPKDAEKEARVPSTTKCTSVD
jgi:hypothetical protein